jgi:hypothetical protein
VYVYIYDCKNTVKMTKFDEEIDDEMDDGLLESQNEC